MIGQSDQSPEAIPARVSRILDQMHGRLSDHDDVLLRDAWHEKWAPSLKKIVRENEQKPRVEIALVGGTGAGKSTLVNALLNARILPVSNMRACTAAISEISFAPENSYRASIEFLSRDEWHKEIEYLISDIRDSQTEVTEPETGESPEIPKVAKDKITAVYGPWESFPNPLNIPALEESPEVREALDRCVITFTESSLESFRTKIRDYLDSKFRFWPIVKTVKVSGPFEALACGATIVDLPGINDPNEARENVTKAYLKQAQFVWVVFNIKRVLTKDVSNLMQSDDFVRQIVMDGRDNCLTFVGTASDDIDIDSAEEEFEAAEGDGTTEIARARNKAVRKEVAAQISDIAERLARNAQIPERAQLLRDSFLTSRVFTVSARDYLSLAKLAKNQALFSSIDDTEIKQLREHMKTTCREYGVEAQTRDLHVKIDQVLHEITAEITSRSSAIDQQFELSGAKRKELGEAVNRLTNFLQRDLADHLERFSQELNSGSEVLNERIKRATERGQHALEHLKINWSRMHWGTLRAVARRGGRYVSPTSGEHDFAADVSKPILDGITFAWTDFFGDRLTNALEKWSSKLLGLAETFGFDVLKEIAALRLDASTRVESDFKSVIKTTEQVIREQVGQIRSEMEHRIAEVRRTLYESIPQQVAISMSPAFVEVAEEKGAGMKQRIVERVFVYAARISRDMFQDMEEKMTQGVRSLNVWLGRKFNEMAETVDRHATTPLVNLMSTEKLSTAEAERKRNHLNELLTVIRLASK